MSGHIVVEFDSSVQKLEALESAAYRILALASCQIGQTEGRFICRLTLKPSPKTHAPSGDELQSYFVDLVTDENLRASLAKKTEAVRNVILSLAFGALATEPTRKE
jgi:His-Xaa-Ser system protein HxsD